MDILWTLIIMIVCLLLEGFFSGSEIAVVSADQMKLRHDAAKGSRGAKLALEMLKKPEWLLSTTLVGTNIAVVTNTTMATALAIYLFGEQSGWLAIVIVAPLIWVFGEVVPKSIFQHLADTITPRVIFFLRVASYLASEHPDILSRLKVLTLFPIVVEDFIEKYKNNISQEAIEQIYAATNSDMRKLEEICSDCIDKAKELKYSLVDINLALAFLTNLPPNN
ncbi:CNNM domain-containing protein [Thermodesulfobacteriota bacterium]